MDQAKDYWGRAEQDLLDRWPKGGDGEFETPAFLTDAVEAGGEAELLCQMLRSYDIPVLRRYEKDGTLGKVVLGFSGYGVKLYGNWQLKKLYLHNQDDNMITLDYNQPLDFFGGKTAMEVAQEAYAMQSYQRKSVPQLRTDGFYNGAVYGLAYSNVGEDTVGGDMFENLED